MANLTKKLSTNIEGNFFVDETCINCDTCRQLAPTIFQEVGEFSAVTRQPVKMTDQVQAYQALLACPTGSIGAVTKNSDLLADAQKSFPIHIDNLVYYNGFNSEKSFGANSYFVVHPDGNWLIDSPRYLKHLVRAFQDMGGVRYIFLSHQDDVADADRYAQEFNATRIIHDADKDAMPESEWIIYGPDIVRASSDFLVIPVPGHTSGSQALLYKGTFLFTGDHLWWDQEECALGMPVRLVWNRRQLLESTRRLTEFSFEWVLPGHGDRKHLSPENMRNEVMRLLDRHENKLVG